MVNVGLICDNQVLFFTSEIFTGFLMQLSRYWMQVLKVFHHSINKYVNLVVLLWNADGELKN